MKPPSRPDVKKLKRLHRYNERIGGASSASLVEVKGGVAEFGPPGSSKHRTTNRYRSDNPHEIRQQSRRDGVPGLFHANRSKVNRSDIKRCLRASINGRGRKANDIPGRGDARFQSITPASRFHSKAASTRAEGDQAENAMARGLALAISSANRFHLRL
jgi:hypothetical protein